MRRCNVVIHLFPDVADFLLRPGGEAQRLAILRALAGEPEILFLDEPTSALDMTVQVQIVDLLRDLQRKYGLAYLFISHDLNVVRQLCRDVMVMYCGRLMETSDCQSLFEHARHPYSAGLVSCIPQISDKRPEMVSSIPGQIPATTDLPEGCHFAPRCTRAEAQCRLTVPELDIDNGRGVACFRPL